MKKIIPSIVLTSICLIVALLLGVVNMFTYDAIKDGREKRALDACREIYKNSDFVDLSNAEARELYGFSDPKSAWEGDKDLEAMKPVVYAASKGGYVFKLTAKGYKSGMVVMCAIDAEGKIIGTKCIESQETFSDVLEDINEGNDYKEKTYKTLKKYIPASASEKSMTSEGYYSAVKAAFEIFGKLGNNAGFEIIAEGEGNEKQ